MDDPVRTAVHTCEPVSHDTGAVGAEAAAKVTQALRSGIPHTCRRQCEPQIRTLHVLN